VLDLGPEIGSARDAVDGFTYHRVERAVATLSMLEEVLNPTVAWDWDIETFV
jgi:hypothetical protein